MKITNEVREQYLQICHKSSFKCNTYEDIDYKIKRAAALGTVIQIYNGETTVGYYRLRFVIKGNKIVRMYDSHIGWNYHVDQEIKDEYDCIHMKLVV